MANRINFNIGFKSDTSQVQSDLNKLKMQLSAITTDPINLSDLDFQPAIKAAQTLQKALNDAFDIDTQNIDLAKFNDSLEASGQNLTTIANTLKGAGVEGVQTFQNLAKVVTNAQTPMKKTNKLLDDMWTTMKNTMKWNISASILNSLQGALQRSYYYAKDLDESLTNISVITGKSREEMASFAESANDAARALNASTTSYTDAALIYYQQGLSEEDVQARTDVTIKAANVARESGEQMSEYLTAIWNGYKVEAAEAELYVDKVSAVAAATAADLAELSEGFSKVASAANAMGVDVDRLNSYLATVISTTREAPETVGTAFRTIFARLNSISLGEEEDGWGLSQVGKTLEKIGISIKDQEGSLRNTGEVMDEIGEKWTTLSHETQQAVAVAMAGRQQYSRLISLFDNWDQYQSTLLVSQQAEGTLQEQANVYAEGWEAAQQRVDTALEGIYTKFLDSDFFIDFLGGLEDAIEDVDTFIDRMGGAGNVLLSFGGIATQVFNKQIANSFNNLIHNISYFTGSSKLKAYNMYDSMSDSIKNFLASEKNLTVSQKAELEGYQRILQLKSQVVDSTKNLTEEQKLAAASQIDLISKLDEQHVKTLANVEALEKEISTLQKRKREILDFESIDDFNVMTNEKELEEEFGRTQFTPKNTLPQGKSQVVYYSDQQFAQVRQLSLEYEKQKSQHKATKEIKDQLVQLEKIGIEQAKARMQTERQVLQQYDQQSLELKKVENLAESLTTKGKLNKQEILEIVDAYELQSSEVKELIKGLDVQKLSYEDIESSVNSIIEKLRLSVQILDTVSTEVEENKQNIDRQNRKVVEGYAEKVNAIFLAQDQRRTSEKLAGAFEDGLEDSVVNTGQLLSNITSLGVEATSFVAQWKQVGKVLRSSADDTEKFATVLTSTITTLPQFGASLFALYRDSKKMSDGLSNIAKNASGLKGSMASLGAAFTSAALPITIVLGLLTVGVAIYQNYKQKQEELAQARLEENQKIIDSIQARQQEQLEIQKLEVQYQELIKSYKDTNENSVELQNVALELAEKYSIQGAAIASLTGDYDDLIQRIQTARELQNQEALNLAQSNLTQVKENIGQNVTEKAYGEEPPGKFKLSGLNLSNDAVDELTAFFESKEIDVKVGRSASWLNGDSLRESLDSGVIFGDSQEALVEAATVLEDFLNTTSTLSEKDREKVQEWLENNTEALEQASTLQKNYLETASQVKLDETFKLTYDYASMSIDEFNRLKDTVLPGLTEIYGSSEEANFALNSYIKTQNIELQKLNVESQGIVDFLEKHKDLQGLSKDTVTNYYESLSDQDKTAFLSFAPSAAAVDWTDFTREFENGLSLAINAAIGANRETLQSALDQLYSEGVIDEETMTALTEAFPELASLGGQALYQQIETIQGYLAQSSADFIASQEIEISLLEERLVLLRQQYEDFYKWTNNKELVEQYKEAALALENIQEQVKAAGPAAKDYMQEALTNAELAYNEIVEKIKTAYPEAKFDIVVDKTNLENEIKETENAIESALNDDFEVFVDVTLQDTDNLISEMEALSEAASKIGEGYRIAADDLDYFAGRFPQMLEGAQAYTDGTIQLNQAIVDSAFATADKDITADRETLKAKLLNQKAMLEFKKQTLQSQLALAQSLANGEITYDQYSKQVQQLAEEQMTAYVAQKYGEQAGEAFKSTSQQSGFIIAVTQLAQEKSDIIAQSFVDAYGDAGDTASNSAAIQVKALNAIEQAAANASQALYAMSINQPYTYKGVTYDSTTVNRVKTAVTADVQSAEDELAKMQNYLNNLEIAQTYIGVPNLQGEIDEYSAEIDKLAKEFGAEKVEELNAQIAATDKELANVNATILKLDSNTVQLTNNIKQVGKAAANGASATKKAIELLDEEIDRYHEINNLIDENNRLLEKTRKNKDRLYGSNYISALEDEIDLLEKDKELTEKKLAISEEQLEVARQGANAAGAEIDANGMISNYYEYLANRQNALNAQIQAGQLTEEEVEAEKEAIELTKKLFDQYEEEFQIYIEQLDRLDEIAQDMADAALEKVTKQVEFDLTITDDSLKVLDYFIQKNEDFFEMAERFDLVEEKYTTIPNQLETYYQGILDLQEQLNDPDANHAEINAKIREYRDGMISSLEAMQELEKEMETAYADALEQGADELSKYTNQLDHVTDSLNHFINLLGLMGKEDHYDTIGRIYEAQIENGRNQLEVQKQMLEGYKQQQELLRQTGMEGTDDWFALVDAIAEAENELYDTTEATLEAIGELYENTIEGILSQLEESLSGSSFDSVSDAYDRYTDEQERFLTKTQQLYELSKLQSDIQQEMDATDSPARKQKLKDLNDYVQGLQEQNKLSQYELEYAQAKYDLALKEMALEEAKNAKTDLRLVRDSQGNWTYQYTADQDAIGDSQQAYQESLNNMYELSLKRVSELEKEVIEINEEMKEALENIERDNYETAEDYQAALLEVREFYQQKLYDVYDQYNIARQNLEKDTYDLTISLTNDAILAAERQKQGYNKNIEDMINKLAGEGSDSFKNATEIAIDAMTKAWQDWRDSVDEVSEFVQLTEDDIIDKTEELEDTSEDLADTITGDVVPAIFSEIDAVRQQVLAFNQAKAALQDLIAKYEEFIRTLQIAEGAQKAVNSKDYSSGSTGDIASSPTGGSSGGSGNTGSNPSNKTDVITGYKVKATTSTGAGLFYETVSATGFNVGPYIGRAAKQAYLDEQVIITVTEKHSITNDKTSTYKVQGTKKRPIYAGENESSITKSPGQALFDTGGYTGDWNSDEGRTAILHEKELVLNKADTENMLQTVGIVRTLKPVLSTIEHNLDLNAQNAMVNRILPSYNISNNYGTDLNQNVRIEASFPNVTNSGEIEQALSNLVNEAAQFAKSR